MTDITLDLTAQIVSAHVANNDVDAEQVPALIQEVYRALAQAGTAEAQPQTREPAVPVKKSVFDDHVVCLECGKSFRVLKRHLECDHNLSVDQYRERFSLPRDYPLVAPEYAETRSRLAKQIGLGRSHAARKQGRKRM